MATFLYFTAICLLILLSLLLCGVILIQESKSSGLGSSFGGDTSDSLFGTSTADVLKKFTAGLSAVFMISCILLSFWTAGLARSKNITTSPATSVEQLQD
jgi:preprotein translocase subunit SecG